MMENVLSVVKFQFWNRISLCIHLLHIEKRVHYNNFLFSLDLNKNFWNFFSLFFVLMKLILLLFYLMIFFLYVCMYVGRTHGLARR